MPAFEQTATRHAAMSRRRRSCLSVPGSSQKMVDKAPSLGADEVVFDLEDAVRPERNDAARALVLSALAPSWGGDGIAAVRVNAVGTRWCHEDIIGTAAARGVTSIVVPKVECAGDVAFDESPVAQACAPMKRSFSRLWRRAQRDGLVRDDITAGGLLTLISSLPKSARTGRTEPECLLVVLDGIRRDGC